MSEQAGRRERNLGAEDARRAGALTVDSYPREARPRSPSSSRSGAERRTAPPLAGGAERRTAPPLAGGAERRTAPPLAGGAERRTIVIRGQVADRGAVRRRPARTYGTYGWMPPERAALWAVLLGLALVVAALASAHF